MTFGLCEKVEYY